MRMSKALGSLVAAAVAVIALSSSTGASADSTHYTATAGKGSIEVTGKDGYHINVQAPWAAIAGSTTLGKDKWTLSEHSAKITGVPAGDVKVKLYVCSGDKCENATATVKVQ